jgi:hypothetical protein
LVFALTRDGHIFVYDKERNLKKWMNIKVQRAFGCSISKGRLFCACADGCMRIFEASTLKHKCTLSKPPPLGTTNILAGVSRIKIPSGEDSQFGDILAG